jgi:23S rRNA (guanosine2251-2'-O)-methyltransferase
VNRIIYGFHSVTARIRSDASTVTEVFLDATRQDGRVKDLRELAESKGIRVMTVDAKRLDGMAAGQRHQGVAANVQVKALSHSLDDILDAASEPALVLVLDGVTDPHNLGACLRVADAAGAHAVVAPKDKAAGLSATVVKVASGAAEYIPYIMVTNLARTLRELKERAIWVVGADSEASEDLYAAKMPVPVAWVLGAEGEGLRRLTRETCDALVNIPMHGSVASLNVSVASGICLFESRRRRMTA